MSGSSAKASAASAATTAHWKLGISGLSAATLLSCVVTGDVGRNEDPFAVGPIPRGRVELATHTLEEAPDGVLGHANAIVGDLDGDGIDDMILVDVEGIGTTYIFYGRPSFPEVLSVGSADATLRGGGWLASAARDLDGDGLADATFAGTHGGQAHVLYGSRERLAGHYEATEVTSTIETETRACSECLLVRAAGDVNGDGYDDLLAVQGHIAGPEFSVHVLYGSPDRLPSRYVVSNAEGLYVGAHDGFAIRRAARAAGDLDGDGYADLLLHTNNGVSQQLELFYGGEAGLSGTQRQPAATFSIPSSPIAEVPMADLDGDGQDELFIVTADRVSIFYGKSKRFSGSYSVGDAAFSLTPESAYGPNHFSAVATGDLDGDGSEELIIGDPFEDRNGVQAGALYMVLGASHRFEGDYELGEAKAMLYGEAPPWELGNSLGYGVASGGDVNGDGHDDVIVGAPGHGLGSGGGQLILGGQRAPDDTVLE